MCANNYLGLADHPEVVEAARGRSTSYGLRHGVGALHLRHPDRAQAARGRAQRLPRHRGHHPLLVLLRRQRRPVRDAARTEEDAVISDALNHASIIDGVRLCKAQRYRYANNDMADLERKLQEAGTDARFKLIATDGVFSMDGIIADLDGDLRPRRRNTTPWCMVDDCHAIGFVGDQRARHPRTLRRDAAGSTSSPAPSARRSAAPPAATPAGGRRSSTGCASARAPTCSPTRWRPLIAAASLRVLELLQSADHLRTPARRDNTARFRDGMAGAGFTIAGADHPIIPVMLGDAESPARWPTACSTTAST